jgi:hypothetical protein
MFHESMRIERRKERKSQTKKSQLRHIVKKSAFEIKKRVGGD